MIKNNNNNYSTALQNSGLVQHSPGKGLLQHNTANVGLCKLHSPHVVGLARYIVTHTAPCGLKRTVGHTGRAHRIHKSTCRRTHGPYSPHTQVYMQAHTRAGRKPLNASHCSFAFFLQCVNTAITSGAGPVLRVVITVCTAAITTTGVIQFMVSITV